MRSVRIVRLTEHHDRFVEEQIAAGKYQNASEVLQAGLRLLEQQSRTEKSKLAILRQLASEGFESLDQGEGLTLTDDKQLANAIGRIGRRAATKN